jgi:hypothetical protein
MAKHRSMIVKELEPQNVDGVSEAQKQYYNSLGFKPYLNDHGSVVWLSPSQHGFRINASSKIPIYRRLFAKRVPQPALKRKKRNWAVKFFANNWLLFLIIAGLMAFVLYYFTYVY